MAKLLTLHGQDINSTAYIYISLSLSLPFVVVICFLSLSLFLSWYEYEVDPQLRGLQITSGHVVMAYMPSQQVRAEGLLAQAFQQLLWKRLALRWVRAASEPLSEKNFHPL